MGPSEPPHTAERPPASSPVPAGDPRFLFLRRLATLCFGVGILLSIASLFGPWYSVTVWNGADVYRETFYLRGVTLSGSQGATPYSTSLSYPDVWLPRTGELYVAALILVVVGAVLMGLVAYLMLTRSGSTRHRRLIGIAVLAVLVAAAGPCLIWGAQPSTICADAASTPAPLGSPSNGSAAAGSCDWTIPISNGGGSGLTAHSESGPGQQNSFVGFETGTYYHSWDASTGWFAAFAGFLCAVMGTLILVRALRAPGTSGASDGPR